MNKIIIFILITGMLLISSCVNYYYTDSGGIRVDNPKVFKYNKSFYTQRSKGLVDTNCIYVLDSIYNKWENPKGIKNSGQFIRFFSGGQVLIVSFDSILSTKTVNDKNIGIQGYFIVDENRIKIDMFQNLNGGQTGKYFGCILKDGSLKFYEQRPETFYGSFSALEKDGRKSFWRKETKLKVIHYVPDW